PLSPPPLSPLPPSPPPGSPVNRNDLDPPPRNDPSTWQDFGQSMSELERHIQTDVYSSMKLFHEIGLQMRKSAREERESSTLGRMDRMGEAANKVREAASWRMAAGIVGGSFTIAGGITNIAGGVQSAKMQADLRGQGASETEISNRLAPLSSKTQGTA